jgi:hypothetical protein
MREDLDFLHNKKFIHFFFKVVFKDPLFGIISFKESG